mmetsp:Transcript_11630/g.43082  ORF Transcript_11630/g.43082 Transcript_11630/m.43082 type:complete len:870 (+) Transcript_11630:2394-5003(+)
MINNRFASSTDRSCAFLPSSNPAAQSQVFFASCILRCVSVEIPSASSLRPAPTAFSSSSRNTRSRSDATSYAFAAAASETRIFSTACAAVSAASLAVARHSFSARRDPRAASSRTDASRAHSPLYFSNAFLPSERSLVKKSTLSLPRFTRRWPSSVRAYASLAVSRASLRAVCASPLNPSICLCFASRASNPCCWCPSSALATSWSPRCMLRLISAAIESKSRLNLASSDSARRVAASAVNTRSFAFSAILALSLAVSVVSCLTLLNSSRASFSSSAFSATPRSVMSTLPSASSSRSVASRAVVSGLRASSSNLFARSNFSCAEIAAARASSAVAAALSSPRSARSVASDEDDAPPSYAASRAAARSSRNRPASLSFCSIAAFRESALCSAWCTFNIASSAALNALALCSSKSLFAASSARPFSSAAAHASSVRPFASSTLRSAAASASSARARASSSSAFKRSSSTSASAFDVCTSRTRSSALRMRAAASIVADSTPSATASNMDRASISSPRAVTSSASRSAVRSTAATVSSLAAANAAATSPLTPLAFSSSSRARSISARASPRYHSFFSAASCSSTHRCSSSFCLWPCCSENKRPLSSARFRPSSASFTRRSASTSAPCAVESPVSLSRNNASSAEAAALFHRVLSSSCLFFSRSSSIKASAPPRAASLETSSAHFSNSPLAPLSSPLKPPSSCRSRSNSMSCRRTSSVAFSALFVASFAARSRSPTRWRCVSASRDDSSFERCASSALPPVSFNCRRASSSSPRASCSICCANVAASCQWSISITSSLTFAARSSAAAANNASASRASFLACSKSRCKTCRASCPPLNCVCASPSCRVVFSTCFRASLSWACSLSSFFARVTTR